MTLDLINKGETFLINKFIIDGEEKEEYVGLSLNETVTLTNIITFRNHTFLCLQNDKYAYLIDRDCASNIYGEIIKDKEETLDNKINDSSKNVSKVLKKNKIIIKNRSLLNK